MLCFSLFTASLLLAQERGSVSVHTDARLAILINKTRVVEPDIQPATKTTPEKKAIAAKPAKTANTDTKSKMGPFPMEQEALQPRSKAAPLKSQTRQYVSWSPGGRYHGPGFRVQIYYGTNRYEALRRKAEFMRNYPTVNTYFTFIAPTYRVKVGDYRHRDDAQGMLKEANGTYSPCMIVPDQVNIH